jgi:hypothetical protein
MSQLSANSIRKSELLEHFGVAVGYATIALTLYASLDAKMPLGMRVVLSAIGSLVGLVCLTWIAGPVLRSRVLVLMVSALGLIAVGVVRHASNPSVWPGKQAEEMATMENVGEPEPEADNGESSFETFTDARKNSVPHMSTKTQGKKIIVSEDGVEKGYYEVED